MLSKANFNVVYTIQNICKNIDIKIKTRLLELGFFEGEKIIVLAKSLAGGVLLVEIRGQVLSLRIIEASCVVIYE